jgi:DNA-directed RNA polymerase specialized sigma subunit
MAAWEQQYEEWRKATPFKKKGEMSKLIKILAPYIYKEANKWKGNISPLVIEAEAKKYAIAAVKSYKPGMSALPTHVSNSIKKVSRLIYSGTGAGKIPEGTILLMRKFKEAWARIEDLEHRDPTVEELADEMSLPKYKAEQLYKKLKSEGTLNEDNVTWINSPNNYDDYTGALDVVYYDLATRDKLIMEHAYGYGGKNVLTTSQMATKMNVSPGAISQRKKFIETNIKDVFGNK